jgi:hypothetical protein
MTATLSKAESSSAKLRRSVAAIMEILSSGKDAAVNETTTELECESKTQFLCGIRVPESLPEGEQRKPASLPDPL